MQDRTALAQAMVHIRLEEADRSTSLGLRPVERGIGVAEYGDLVHAVDRVERDADAQADAQAMSLDLEIVREGGDEPLGEPRRVGRGRAFSHDDRELVAADAGEKGTLERRAQASRRRANRSRSTDRTAKLSSEIVARSSTEAKHALNAALLGRSVSES
jgi:hypothetical protein